MNFDSSPSLSIVGIPFAGGQSHAGVVDGPAQLRAAGLAERLRASGWRVRDGGDIPDLAHAPLAPRDAIAENHRIATLLGSRHSGADLAINLGGDHGIGLATIAATLRQHPDAVVIWVDAHGDINRPETSPSGHFHGMPLAMALGRVGRDLRPHLEWMPRTLDPRRLILVGARSLDPGEHELIRQCEIPVHGMEEIRSRGIAAVVRDVLDHAFRDGARPLHLSFDVDVMDPEIVPTTGTPVREGLGLNEALELCHRIRQSGKLVAMDIVELNPRIASQFSARTARIAVDLIAASVGPAERSERWIEGPRLPPPPLPMICYA